MPNCWWVETGHFSHIYREHQNTQGHQSRWHVNTVTPGRKGSRRNHGICIHNVIGARSGHFLLTLAFRSSNEKGCQGKKLLPAPLRDAGAVTYIRPHLIPHLMLRGVIGLVALARRTVPRQSQPQLLVPTRQLHEVSGARRRSVLKLRKLCVGLSANQDPM